MVDFSEKEQKEIIFAVGIQLYGFQIKDIPCHFSKIVKTLDGRIKQNEISKALDYLTDHGMLDELWKQTDEGLFYRAIELSSVGYEFMKDVHNQAIERDLPAP